jgi:peptidoglycan hydrolase FlgJ
MGPLTGMGGAAGWGVGEGGREPAKIRDAAREFEAVLIEQMLRGARAAGSGEWMGEDQTGSALSEMAEQQFARALSAGGGLGLAKLVMAGLEQRPGAGVTDEDR